MAAMTTQHGSEGLERTAVAAQGGDAGAVAPVTVDDLELARRLARGRETILRELGKVIIGQEQVLDEVLFTLFVGGNSIVTGVPGLAKTLIIQTISEILDLDYSRIQFTPDLMPADIVGTNIVQEHAHGGTFFEFQPGPIFANVVLADEINRTPPKTQAALLQAMQERAVTAAGETYPLPPPFFVLSTQNPIEQEGTYPLPEAQLDRFLFEVIIGYSPEADEVAIVRATTAAPPEPIRSVVSREEWMPSSVASTIFPPPWASTRTRAERSAVERAALRT